MTRQVDVIILGMGTAALAAAREVRRVTDSFILVSDGVRGTTCVLSGYMPAVTLIEATLLYHQRHRWRGCGIHNGGDCTIDIREMLAHVRHMREHFLHYTMRETESFSGHIVEGKPWFLSPAVIQVDGRIYEGKRVVLATGSTPVIPACCHGAEEFLLTSDNLFEQESLPAAIGVLGMDVLGVEMAQAFARIGIAVTAAHDGSLIGGLSDPAVSNYAAWALAGEMSLWLNHAPSIRREDNRLRFGDALVDKLFVAMDRKANVQGMGLEACGVIAPGQPITNFDPQTMQVGSLPLFVAGDVKPGRSLLHNASDEGKIAGYNAARETVTRFRRRTGLQIVHSCPTLAVAGRPLDSLEPDSYVVGETLFENQGRAVISGKTKGIVRIYARREDGLLLGTELFAPEGEHLAHSLAWIIDRGITVGEALKLPFYHPSFEEGLRSALGDAEKKLEPDTNRKGNM